MTWQTLAWEASVILVMLAIVVFSFMGDAHEKKELGKKK